MKTIITCVTICVLAITCLLWIDMNTRMKDLQIDTQIKMMQMSERMDAQDKEIRLLRQDVDIIENGYRPK